MIQVLWDVFHITEEDSVPSYFCEMCTVRHQKDTRRWWTSFQGKGSWCSYQNCTDTRRPSFRYCTIFTISTNIMFINLFSIVQKYFIYQYLFFLFFIQLVRINSRHLQEGCRDTNQLIVNGSTAQDSPLLVLKNGPKLKALLVRAALRVWRIGGNSKKSLQHVKRPAKYAVCYSKHMLDLM